MAKRRTAEEIEAESIYIDHHGRKGHLVGLEDFQALIMAYEIAEGAETALDASGAVEHATSLELRGLREILPQAYDLAQQITFQANGGFREKAYRLEQMLAQMGGYGAHERRSTDDLGRQADTAAPERGEGTRELSDRSGAGADTGGGAETEAETYTGGAFSSLTPEQRARELRRRRRLTEIAEENAR